MEAHRFCDFALPPPLSLPRSAATIIFPGVVMDEAVSAHVHYNASHLFFSARLSALQEMPERYGIHEERADAHLILWREFALSVCVCVCACSHQSITNEDTPTQALFLK